MGIFREYDIRGVVGKDLTPELAERIGRAYGSLAVRAGAKAVAMGRDGRTSAMQMRAAVLKGLDIKKEFRQEIRQLSAGERDFLSHSLEQQMQLAADNLEFEKAARLRDEIIILKEAKKRR